MRSESVGRRGQECLPFDPPPRTLSASPPERPAPVVGEGAIRHRMVDDALASLGWPAGTELVLEPCTTPQRGQVVLARDGSQERIGIRSEEHTSELQSLMRSSYAVFCLKKKNTETKKNRKIET